MKISSLWVYPIKSVQGLSLPIMTFDKRGPLSDRRFMLVDDKGKFITQRQFSILSQLSLMEEDDNFLISSSKASRAFRLPKNGRKGAHLDAQIWGDKVQLVDQGNEAAEFFSDFLGKSVRLVFQDDLSCRLVNGKYTELEREVSLADGFPFLLINQASMDALNQAFSLQLTSERFRPNIVLDGLAPFQENNLNMVTIGDVIFDVVKPCSRCVIPTINPSTSQKEPDVWKALKAKCLGRDGKVYFGQNLIPRETSGTFQLTSTIQVN